MGFGDLYRKFPGGEEGFCHFLSSGIEGWPEGPALAEQVKPFLRGEAFDNFVHGERYFKSSAQVKRFVDLLPTTEIPRRYALFAPLAQVDPAGEPPRTVIFFADPDELSALVVLANYGRGDNENVTIPYAAGCQTIGIYPYREALSTRPRAVVGLTDLSARLYIRKQLGENLLSFAIPFALFDEMERNVEGVVSGAAHLAGAPGGQTGPEGRGRSEMTHPGKGGKSPCRCFRPPCSCFWSWIPWAVSPSFCAS